MLSKFLQETRLITELSVKNLESFNHVGVAKTPHRFPFFMLLSESMQTDTAFVLAQIIDFEPFQLEQTVVLAPSDLKRIVLAICLTHSCQYFILGGYWRLDSEVKQGYHFFVLRACFEGRLELAS